jgi:hypothetical protein
MSVPAVRPHRLAVLALLQPTAPNQLGDTQVGFWDGQIPGDAAYPYVVFWSTPGELSAPAAQGDFTDVLFRFQLVAVGTTQGEADGAIDLARPLILGVTPVIAGRSCWQIDNDPAPAPMPDRDDTDTDANNIALFYAYGSYRLFSTPA